MIRSARTIWLAGLTLGLLSFAAPPTIARDHHVAVTGNDASADGTAASPWGTIGQAVQAAESGDVIVIHEGLYRESVRVRLPNITLRSADNERATIQSGFGTPNSAALCVMFDVDASHGKLQRLELIGGYYCVFLQTRWDWGDANRNGVSDILIEDCEIHDSGRDCIKITPKCDRVTIRRCEIYNSGQMYPPGTPFDDKNAEGVDVTSGDRVVVQDCYIHDTATTGLYFKGGAQDCVVERTRVSRCGQAGVLLGFDTSPEFFDTTVNPGYYECVRGVVRNCIIEETNYAGIGFYAARDVLAANNTIINTARVGHSPIYFGLTFQDWDPNAARPACKNVRIVNNVVAQLDAIAQPAIFIRYSPELGGMSGLDGIPVMNNNMYFVAGGMPRFGDARPTSELSDADFSAWQAHIGGDANSLVIDPLLDGDGHLTSASPAIDRGAALEMVVDDFDGQARGALADMGADEFGATSRPDVPSAPAPGGNPPNSGAAAVPPVGGATEPPSAGGAAPPAPAPPAGQASADEADDAIGAVSGGFCPASAMAFLSLSLLGVRRAGRARKSAMNSANK